MRAGPWAALAWLALATQGGCGAVTPDAGARAPVGASSGTAGPSEPGGVGEADAGPSGDGACAHLCSLRPTRATLQRPGPRLDLVTTRGERFTSASLRGKVVVLHAWRSFGGDVVEDLPHLARLRRTLGAPGDVAVFSVSLDEVEARARDVFDQLFDHEHPFGFVAGEPARAAVAALAPEALPAVWVIDQRGDVVARFDGRAPLDAPSFVALVESLRRREGCSRDVDRGACPAR